MVTNIFVDLLFIVILLSGFYASYRAGWNDGRRWERIRTDDYHQNPIQMDHHHGGDADDL